MITSRRTGEVAVTVAVRGAFVRSAISPNQSPGPRSATLRAVLVHADGALDEHEELVTWLAPRA